MLVIANQLRRERDGFSRSRAKALLHASPVAAYLVGLTAAKAFQELCSTAESLRGLRCSREKAAMWALPD